MVNTLASLLVGIVFAGATGDGQATATPSADRAQVKAEVLTNYSDALKEAKQEGRPLLVMLVKGSSDSNLTKFADLTKSEKDGKVVSVYKVCSVDVDTEYGQKVAKAFKAQSFPHTVIIDKTASVQIFKKTGTMSYDEFRSVLVENQSGRRRLFARARRAVCRT